MPTWPVSVPDIPLAGTLVCSDRDNTLKGPSDIDGLESRRRRYSAVAADYVFSLILTHSQYETLRDFYKNDCAGGALSFTHVDYSLVLPRSKTFTWSESPKGQVMPSSDYWSVQVSLVRSAE